MKLKDQYRIGLIDSFYQSGTNGDMRFCVSIDNDNNVAFVVGWEFPLGDFYSDQALYNKTKHSYAWFTTYESARKEFELIKKEYNMV